MELVKGRTLDALIPQKGLRLQNALRYAIQITDALAAAHTAGIVHRDLKPGNVMVTDQDQIKILDFGLATLTEAEPTSAVDETRAQAAVVETGAGTILGTVAYMSPEQAEGRRVDARSDIFSFGAILYEMLSGQRLPRELDARHARGGYQPRAATARDGGRRSATGGRPAREPLPAKRAEPASAARL
jgi:eukaryotic-like serine/threonine-protein kinase